MCYGKDQKKLIVCKRKKNPKTGAETTGIYKKERMEKGNEKTQTIQKILVLFAGICHGVYHGSRKHRTSRYGSR